MSGTYSIAEARDRLSQVVREAELAASELVILPYQADAARWHAGERGRLQREGLTPAFADGQIAAVAHVNGLVLVTANLSDFAHFEGVQLANWL